MEVVGVVEYLVEYLVGVVEYLVEHFHLSIILPLNENDIVIIDTR